mmetsp:Transcript_106936/g.300713  ORF Transcript_106936/g.300713 Transcript_106936/m.300713 type:complete len:315 (-) Transcript_106936:199-1143(-)
MASKRVAEDSGSASGEPAAKVLKPSPACVKRSGRLGRLLQHDVKDDKLTYKLAFDDGKEPTEDWFAADAVEIRPSLEEWAERVRGRAMRRGSPARATTGGGSRVGQVLAHDPADPKLAFKLKFEDGNEPREDWYPAHVVEVQPSLEELRNRAQTIRREAVERLDELQVQIQKDFDEYKTRLSAWAAGKAGASVARLIIGLVPLAHGVSEGVAAASLANEVKELAANSAQAAVIITEIVDLYKATSATLHAKEHLLLNVLVRQTRVFGEKHVIGGHEFEPGHRVVDALLEIKALCERLRTLDELGFFSKDAKSIK